MPPGFYKRMIYENRLIEIRQLCLFDFAIMSVLLSNSQIEKMKKMHEARKKLNCKEQIITKESWLNMVSKSSDSKYWLVENHMHAGMTLPERSIV